MAFFKCVKWDTLSKKKRTHLNVVVSLLPVSVEVTFVSGGEHAEPAPGWLFSDVVKFHVNNILTLEPHTVPMNRIDHY